MYLENFYHICFITNKQNVLINPIHILLKIPHTMKKGQHLKRNNNNEFVKRKPLHYCSLVKSFYEQLTATLETNIRMFCTLHLNALRTLSLCIRHLTGWSLVIKNVDTNFWTSTLPKIKDTNDFVVHNSNSVLLQVRCITSSCNCKRST